MRIVPGNKLTDGSITATTLSLAEAFLTKPEITNKVVELYRDQCQLLTFLQTKGKVRRDISNTDTFKIDTIAGNTRVMWPLMGYPEKIVNINQDSVGVANQIGLNNSEFDIFVDDPYFNKYDVLATENRRVQLFVKRGPVNVAVGRWKYTCVLNTLYSGDFISTVTSPLLVAGKQLGRLSTKFPEMSLTGYESHIYPEWYTNRMTIQRLKASISGSALKSKLWIEHNGILTYWNQQENNMVRKMHIHSENALIWDRATTDAADITSVWDDDGKPVASGDGLIEQIDGSFRRNYFLDPDGNMDIGYVDDLLQDMRIMAAEDGVLEVVFAGGNGACNALENTLRSIYKYEPSMITTQTPEGLIVGKPFAGYYHGGVRLIPIRCNSFDAPNLPSSLNKITGRKNETYRMIMMTTGIGEDGISNVELLTLGNGMGNRAFLRKEFDGMESVGGMTNKAMTPLDGAAVQVLREAMLKVGNPFGCGQLEIIGQSM